MDVLIIRALLFVVHIWAPDFWKLPHSSYMPSEPWEGEPRQPNIEDQGGLLLAIWAYTCWKDLAPLP